LLNGYDDNHDSALRDNNILDNNIRDNNIYEESIDDGKRLLTNNTRPVSITAQNLLQLAEEAEKQARLTAASAETANSLAQSLIADLHKGGDDSLRLLAEKAVRNAFITAEAAVQAQVSAIEAHAAAVNQSLADFETAKDTLHLHSQGFINLSKQATQAQEEADIAREQADRSRFEYAAKQNFAINNRDALLQSKREYEAKLNQTRSAQENLELVQKRARNVQNDFLHLKDNLEDRRYQWRHLQQNGHVPKTPDIQMQQPPRQIATAAIPATEAPLTERRQLTALIMKQPEQPSVYGSAAFELAKSPARHNALLREEQKSKELRLLALIQTSKLCKSFSSGGIQQHVLRNLDMEIYEGDFTVIMGPSGAGKSTLLYALSGMDKPTLGSIRFFGQEISKFSNDQLALFRRKHCGFVFQQMFLLDNMSIIDNVLAAGLLVSKDKKAIVARAKELLKQVGLTEQIWRKFPTQLAGGEAQRAAIVRALINRPKVVFADEPTGSMNSASGTAALDALTKVNENGQSVIAVTHDIKTALRGNRVLYIRDGVIYGTCILGKYSGGSRERHDRLTAFLDEMGW